MESLQELARYVRNTIPVPQAMLQLRINERAAGITFIWQGVEFFVNTTLYAFEVRGHTLYITGLSTLLQGLLANRRTTDQRYAALVDQLSEAEVILRDERFMLRAVEIVRAVRQTVQRLSGRSRNLSTVAYPKPASVLPHAA